MTAPLNFEPEEVEGADLGSVFVAGQACVSCGIPSFTGARCTRCAVAGAPDTGFWVGRGTPNALRRSEAVSAQSVQDPEMVCEDMRCPHEPPDPVLMLWADAADLGWHVTRGHSLGGVMGGNGKQLAVAELWSVRFRRGPWQGYAVRRGKAWDSVCIAGETLPPFLALGVTDLRQWLADPERPGGKPLSTWVAGLRERVAGQAGASKIVKCPGPGECAWVDEGRGDHTHRANGEIKVKTSKKEKATGL